jgi:MoaA/NifB/PqqE/SkfB family radical SAM enzyme
MNNLSSIALLVTYQCNIECKHCGLSCSPKNKEWMSLDEMRSLAVQASDLLNTDGLKELEDELVSRKIMHLSTIYSPNYVYQ